MTITIRHKLAPYLGQRVRFRGGFVNTGFWEERNKDVRRACIRPLEINGETVAHHVWVFGTKLWEDYLWLLGRMVSFEAKVYPYEKGGVGTYCLREPTVPVLLDLPCLEIGHLPARPCLNGSGETKKMEVSIMTVEATSEISGAPAIELAGTVDLTLEQLKQIRSFVKACGGWEKASPILTMLEKLNMSIEKTREVALIVYGE